MWEQLAQEILKLSQMLEQATSERDNIVNDRNRLRVKIAELERLAEKNNKMSDMSEDCG